MGIITGLIDLVLLVFELALIAYVVISWLKPASNRWIELLKSVVEPVLVPIRKVLVQKLPSKYQNFDWSPVAAIIIVAVIRILL